MEVPTGRRQLMLLLVVVCVQNIAYTVLIPLVPRLRTDFRMSVLAVALAFAGFTATKALSQPVGGWLSDRLGPRRIGLAGLVVAAGSTLALAFAHTGGALLVTRLVWGVGEGLAIPALLVLTTELGRASGVGTDRAIGWFGSAAVTGMALGPLVIVPFGGAVTVRQAFLVAGAMSVASAALFARLPLPQQPIRDRPAVGNTPRTGVAGGGREFLAVVLALGLLDFVNNFIYAGLEPLFAAFGAAVTGSARAVSIVLFLGLLAFAAAAPLAGSAIAGRSALRLATGFFLVQAACLAVPAGLTTAAVEVVAFIVFMAAQSSVYVCVRGVLAGLRGDYQGRAFGLFGLVSDLGWVTGPLVVAGMFGRPQSGTLLLWAALAVLAAAGAALLAWFRRRERPPRVAPPVPDEAGLAAGP